MDPAKITRIDRDNVLPYVRKLYAQASAIALAGNVLLVVAKGLAAWASGSSAIFADAANSASDVAYSLLMGVGLWLALRPPDEGHPHGHRRIETLVSTVIGLMMAVAGIEAARSGYGLWREGAKAITSLWAYVVPVGVVIIKGLMYVSVRRLGEQAKSPALMAAARDNLSDVVTSATALIGVALSRLLPLADPIAALLVALWIFRNAYKVLRESIAHMVGAAASPELVQKIVDTIQAVPGVSDVHQVIVEHVGPQVRADIHINMPGNLSLDEVHRVSDAVRDAVESLDEVDHAFIHVEPVES